MRTESGAPSLAANSKTNQSLILQWLPSRAAGVEDLVVNLTYRIQRLIVGLDDDWLYHGDVTWLSRQRVLISGLRPYVTYKVWSILFMDFLCLRCFRLFFFSFYFSLFPSFLVF